MVTKQTITKVAQCLEELGAFTQHGDDAVVAKRGSTVVVIRVRPWEEDAMGHVEANVVQGARLDTNLLVQLLQFNATSAYGAFGIDEGGTITVHHCLLGSTLHKDELVLAVQDVAKVADDWDDVILDQAGGKRAVDRLEEHTRPRPQPTIEPPASPSAEQP